MIPEEALAAYDAQVRQATDTGEPGARAERDGDVVRLLIPPEHGMSWITWSRLAPGTAGEVIAAQRSFFAARAQPVEWKLYDYDQPADLGARLRAAGFVPGATEVLMVAESAQVAADVPVPEGVTVRQVTGAAGVDQVMGVGDLVFGDDRSDLRESLAARLAGQPASLALLVALAGDEPVAAARAEFPPGTDFAGLWGGGTLPDWRGRGLYRALVASRARLAAARGYRYVQVDALPSSQPILARLGFTALARTTPYVWEPGTAGGSLPAGR